MTDKLWDKGFKLDNKIEEFTVGRDREMDMYLAEYDVLGSMAHVKMLQSIKILTKEEEEKLYSGLKEIWEQIIKREFKIEAGVEDIHSQVEILLTKKLGNLGKKIHSGRSRNDQILLDLRLYIRYQIREISSLVVELFETLINLSEKHKNTLLPGYTHLQVAMPSSFGLWFGAYAESLIDDMHLIAAAYKVVNQNPLGSAAGYGSSFPLNRTMTTKLLGFDTLNYNVVYAQMTRGRVEKTLSYGMSSVASTMGKLASDICMYVCENFSFISFPDYLTTGSSIMPHKKNPDVFELIRAKCNKLIALPNELSLVTANLTSGYFRDMQLIKENFLPAINDMKHCLKIMRYALGKIIIKEDILKDPRYKYLFSTEAVNQEVLKGASFRDAYRSVGQAIESGEYVSAAEINHTHEGSIGNLCNQDIINKMKKVMSNLNFDKVNKAMDELLGG